METANSPTWISEQVAKERLGIGRCQFFAWLRRGKAAGQDVVREAGKAANGKPRREIQLEFLPAKYQTRFSESARAGVEGDGVNPSPDADCSLSTGGLSAPSMLVGRSEDELSEATRLAEDLDAVLRAPNRREEIRLLAVRLGKTPRTIENYMAAYKKDRLAGLVRKKRKDAGKVRSADRRDAEWINAEYLKPHKPSVREIYEAYCRRCIQSNRDPRSESWVRSVCDSVAPDLFARRRIGEREYQNKFAYYARRKKPPAPRMWVDGDHHQWDRPVIFRDGSIGRPWLTAIRDNCTLEILGFSVNANQTAGKYSNSRTIANVLRLGILRKQDKRWPSFGLFDYFYTDLGKDFRSTYIRAVCGDLGISWVPARGYHGQSKPIERWFRTMEDQLRRLPGYIGNKPENNPERQRIGAPRTWEEMRKELMTIDQLEKALLDWIVGKYHHADSRALKGISPMAALESHVKTGWTAREVRDERALDLLLMERLEQGGKSPSVRRGKIQAFGTTLEPRYFDAPELCELSGQEVQAFYDPDKVGELIVYKDNRFVCVAKNEELLNFGATKEDMKRRLEIERHQRRRLRERIEEIQTTAQYPNATQQAIAERRYSEAIGELREELVANAEPKRTVYKLLPKYQLAAKALKAVPKGPIVDGAKAAKEETNPWLKDESPGPAEYKRERNQWLDDDDRLLTSEELFPCRYDAEPREDLPTPEKNCCGCGESGSSRMYCFDCLIEGATPCPACGENSAHAYCGGCFAAHDHKNPGACCGCGKPAPESMDCCPRCQMERGETCPTCHSWGAHRYCSDCINSHNHVARLLLEVKDG